jgi:hypothetical protein
MIDPNEFAIWIADRLYDLEERESAPTVAPHAIRAFAVVPN